MRGSHHDGIIGTRIRRARQAKRISQATRGLAVGLSWAEIDAIETGFKPISDDSLAAIAARLDVMVPLLQSGDGEPLPTAASVYMGAQPLSIAAANKLEATAAHEALDIVHAFARIKDAATRRRAVTLINALADAFGEPAARETTA